MLFSSKKKWKKKKCNKSQSCYQPVRLYLFINQPLSIELIHHFRRTPFFNILILYLIGQKTRYRIFFRIEVSTTDSKRIPLRVQFALLPILFFFFLFFLFSFFYAILASDFKIACERALPPLLVPLLSIDDSAYYFFQPSCRSVRIKTLPRHKRASRVRQHIFDTFWKWKVNTRYRYRSRRNEANFSLLAPSPRNSQLLLGRENNVGDRSERARCRHRSQVSQFYHRPGNPVGRKCGQVRTTIYL